MKIFTWVMGIGMAAVFAFCAFKRYPTPYFAFVWPLVWALMTHRVLDTLE